MSWLHADPSRDHPASLYAEVSPPPPPRPRLEGTATADLCVVGGGLTGLSAALHAARAGRSVIVLDARRVGWGASGRNGGQLHGGFNWSQRRLAARLGDAAADALWQEAREALALTRALVAAHAPEARLQGGVVHAALTPAEQASAAAEAAWMAERHGTAWEVLGRDALAHRIGTAAYAGGVLDPEGGFLNPLAYVTGLARACERAGVTIHEDAEVHRVAPGRVATGQGRVACDWIVHATNGLGAHLTPATAARLLPLNNYVGATPPGTGPMREPVAVSDSRVVVNYFWQDDDGRLIFGGGESYGRRFPPDVAARVRRSLHRVYPGLPLSHAWGGTLAVTATRLPYLGEPAPRVLAAGGYSGHGLALSAHFGRAMAERVGGDGARMERLGRLPVPALPGGRWLGGLAVNAAMGWGAARDRWVYG